MSDFDSTERADGPPSDLPAALEQLLMQYVEAEPAEAATLEREIAAWDEYRATTADWIQTARLLREQAAEDAEILADVESRPVDPTDLVLAREVILEGSRETAPRSVARRYALAAAAGLLVAAGLGWRVFLGQSTEPVDPDPRRVLLGDHLEPGAPVGEVSGFERFSWEVRPLPLFGSYRLIVDSIDGERLLDVSDLEQPVYTPSTSELEGLQDAGRIVWEVEALDRQEGCFARVPETEAWLPGR